MNKNLIKGLYKYLLQLQIISRFYDCRVIADTILLIQFVFGLLLAPVAESFSPKYKMRRVLYIREVREQFAKYFLYLRQNV